jgi:sterol desaturase/sphingolipid hydroxylase (fatty acid hydroxylase superfamily)
LYFIVERTREKANSNNNDIQYFLSSKENKNILTNHLYVFQSTLVETLTHEYLQQSNLLKQLFDYNDSPKEIIYFIPISFLFELIFDFFHYIMHRLLHNKYVYKYFHKTHHKYKHPTAIGTFYQDPVDIILTNSIPNMITLYILPIHISYLQYNWITIYKTFVEISGHTGKKLSPSCSFTQCIWFVKYLNIELYAEEHDLHHSLNNCNYGKRFSLWDKLFGTFTPKYIIK